jgi:hypothetical protein
MTLSSKRKAAGIDDQAKSDAVITDALRDLWQRMNAAGVAVLAIRDTPRMPIDMVECLEKDKQCAIPRNEVLRRDDPITLAAEASPGVTLVDMTDSLCGPEFCPAVAGNLIVWRDRQHITATYACFLAPELLRADHSYRPPRNQLAGC